MVDVCNSKSSKLPVSLMSARQFPTYFLLIPATPSLVGWQPPDITNLLQLTHLDSLLSLSLSLYRICWESQWSVLGCLAIASAMQAKDDKTAFLKCPTFLILGSRQTNQACGFRERVLSSRSSETFPYLSTSKASPIEMTSPI